MPTKVVRVEPHEVDHGQEWKDRILQNYKIHTARILEGGNFFTARKQHMFNNDVAMYTAKVTSDTEDFIVTLTLMRLFLSTKVAEHYYPNTVILRFANGTIW